MTQPTPEWMRSLADAVDNNGTGIRFQPIHPETLRKWADEIERLRDQVEHVYNQGYVDGNVSAEKQHPTTKKEQTDA